MPSITAQDYLTKDFFDLVGLDSLPVEEKETLVEQMNQTVLARVYSHIYTELSEPEREELDNISTANIVPFLQGRGFEVPKMVVEEAGRYRMELAYMMSTAVPGSMPALAEA